MSEYGQRHDYSNNKWGGVQAGGYRSLQEDEDKDLRCKCCKGGFYMSRTKYCCSLGCGCLLLTLGILLVLIFAIAPAIMRSQLSGSTLEFGNLLIEGAPTNSSAHMITTATIGHVMNIGADLEAMPLTLTQITTDSTISDDEAAATNVLGTLMLPALHLHGSTVMYIDSNLSIASVAAFEQFTHDVLFSDFVHLAVHGEVTVTPKIMGITLPTQRGVSFDKSVTLTGCSGLTGVEVLSFSLKRSTATQMLVDASIAITNPSPFSMNPIGQLSFDLYYASYKQGSLQTLDAETRMDSGVNVLNFTGELTPDPKHIEFTNQLIALYLTGQGAQLQAKTGEQASSIPVYSRAMQGLTMQTFLPGLANGSLITGLNLLSGTLSPSLSDDTVQLDLSLQFDLDSPLGLQGKMELLSMQMEAQVAFLNHTIDETTGEEIVVPLPVGHLTMPDGPISVKKVAPFSYQASISSLLQLNSLPANFQQFVRSFVAAKGMVGLELTGFADVKASYLYGDLAVQGVPVQNTLFVQGAGGLTQTQEHSMQVHDNREICSSGPSFASSSAADAVAEVADENIDAPKKLCGVYVDMHASMVNPSLLTLNLSSSWFDLLWDGTRLGSLQMSDLFIAPGYNPDVFASGFLNPAQEDLDTISIFMSQYIAGINHTMSIKGLSYDPSSSIDEGNANANANAAAVAEGVTIDAARTNSEVAVPAALSAHDLLLSAVEAPAECHGIKVTSLLGNVSIASFQFSFADGGGVAPFRLQSAAEVLGTIVLPPELTIPLHMQSTEADFDILFDVDGDGQLESIGAVSVPRFPVTYVPGSDSALILSFANALFTVSAAQVPLFQAFAFVVLNEPSVTITMSGSVNPVVDTNMGQLSLNGVPVSREVAMEAYNSFISPLTGESLVKVVHLDLIGAKVGPTRAQGGPYLGGGSVDLRCNVTLENPSAISITNLGLLEFDIWFQGVRIVTVGLSDFSFLPGLNVYDHNCLGHLFAPALSSPTDTIGLASMAKTKKFISDYIDGFENEVLMIGQILQADGSFKPGTNIELLQTAFQAFQTNLTVKGQPMPFITALTVLLTLEEASKIIADQGGIVGAIAHLYNPFGTALTITHLNLTVIAGNLTGSVAGHLVPGYGFAPIYIPPFTAVDSLPLAVFLFWDADVMATLFAILFGETHSAPVSATGDMEVWVGSTGPGQPDPRVVFNQTVWAAQENVPATLANSTVREAASVSVAGGLGAAPTPVAPSSEEEATRRAAKAHVQSFINKHLYGMQTEEDAAAEEMIQQHIASMQRQKNNQHANTIADPPATTVQQQPKQQHHARYASYPHVQERT